MDRLTELHLTLLIYCSDEWCDLGALAAVVGRALPTADRQAVRSRTLELLGDLLHAGLIEAGQPTRAREWVPWGLSAAETLEHLRREWEGVDADRRRLPVGAIAWFTATPKGVQAIHVELDKVPPGNGR